MSVLVHRCLGRSRLVEELVEDWQIEHKNVMLLRDVEELASECLELGKLVQHVWGVLSEELFDGRIEDLEGIGEEMRVAIEKTRHVVALVSNAICEVERKGYVSKQGADLRLAAHEIEQVAKDFKKTWPTANLQMAQESLTAYNRGEYQKAGDLLHAHNRGSETNR